MSLFSKNNDSNSYGKGIKYSGPVVIKSIEGSPILGGDVTPKVVNDFITRMRDNRVGQINKVSK